MLVFNDVSKSFFSNKPNEVKALDRLSLTVSSGEFVSVVGANGSGKSTLQNLVAGTIMADRGNIRLNGELITGMADYKRSRWIARVFQDPLQGTAPELSILDNFRLAALRGKAKKLKIGIDKAFKERVKQQVQLLNMGLEDKIHQPMGLLSGGQRQALTLLMTVMNDVKLLLLDEPTAALDPRSASRVMELANRLVADYQLTVLFITHNMKEALRYGDRLIQLSHGRIKRDVGAEDKGMLKPQDLYEWFNED
ncbi:ABC transporter ATP-binding protein [Olivibacter sp. XZL3]|uniref:ABC transporter ATP-binding protein n=1 Tax=Olivibacter sp. XZL3 TaxID=1735116 RepID=UPI0010660B3E|nr:ATP-binding cassette domain-containing protein [Olivibacter sp. XZL3]